MSETDLQTQTQSRSSINPWIYRMAILTTALSLLPIVLGALTTTQNAGMAFPDWPTSDGQGMFSYPWLQLMADMGTSFDAYQKFLEHSHRLAGIVIGIAAIGLAVVCCLPGSTRTLMWLGLGVLVAVIIQGGLGGFRVQLNESELAMIHGLFASLVFSLMCITCVVSSRGWNTQAGAGGTRNLKWARIGSAFFYGYLLMQYALGGMIRHPVGMRSPVHEHLGFGILALILVHVLLVIILKTKSIWLRRSMRLVLIAVGLQVVLGLVTYAAKFGVPALGIVAVSASTGQVLSRTGHMVLGVLVMGATAALVAKTFHARQDHQAV